MDKLKVAAIQADLVWEDHAANRQLLAETISGIEAGVDLIILPEMFATGFSMDPARLGEEKGGESVEWMKRISAERKCALAGSLIVTVDGKHYNRMYFADSGEITAIYDKRHLFQMAGEHEVFTGGTERVAADFRGWKIALNVCYDLRFPVFSRRTSDFQYDLLINCANWPEVRSSHWRALLPARAIENQSFVIGVNRVGQDGNEIPYCGDSVILDFMGEELANAGKQAGVIVAELDPEPMKRYREKFPAWRDADTFAIKA